MKSPFPFSERTFNTELRLVGIAAATAKLLAEAKGQTAAKGAFVANAALSRPGGCGRLFGSGASHEASW
jgi:hypothetical protein